MSTRRPALRNWAIQSYWMSFRHNFSHTTDATALARPHIKPVGLPLDKLSSTPDIPFDRFVRENLVGPVLWLIHGFNAELDVADKSYNQITNSVEARIAEAIAAEAALAQTPEELASPTPLWLPRTIIRVLWAGGWSGGLSFTPAWARAAVAGAMLAETLESLGALMYQPGARVREPRSSHRFVAHSMGARVACEALADPYCSHIISTYTRSQLHLCSAAIDADTLAPGRPYAKLADGSTLERCVSAFSTKDPVLKLYPTARLLTRAPWRYFVPALGAGKVNLGPEEAPRLVQADFSTSEHGADHGGARKCPGFYTTLLAPEEVSL